MSHKSSRFRTFAQCNIITTKMHRNLACRVGQLLNRSCSPQACGGRVRSPRHAPRPLLPPCHAHQSRAVASSNTPALKQSVVAAAESPPQQPQDARDPFSLVEDDLATMVADIHRSGDVLTSRLLVKTGVPDHLHT